ncbi:MAG: beta-lactamase family protein [Bacteroidales bacterium]|nr:beta-lactamase family protein [Bacteroidales bacterium]
MKKTVKLLFIVILVLLSGYGPEAVENDIHFTEKLVPGNIRLSNELSDYPEFDEFEKVINKFIRRWNIVGASIAVAKDGKLVYAKGFGYADSTLHEPVQPFSRFRIASISKLVTATAIMKLQEEGKISVYDKVFGPGGILNDPFYSNPKDKRVYNITVAHLLAHESGWTTRWGDQMFMPLVVAKEMGISPPVDTKTIVRFALNKNLHYTPGTGRSYSNLGYAILGLVIEKVTGMPYEVYCRKNILESACIYDMCLAHNLKKEKLPFEVSYYEPDDAILKMSVYGTGELLPASYGGNDIESLGAAGAWVATAPDLVKFVLAIDGCNTEKDILSKESVEFMTNIQSGYAPAGWKATSPDGTWWRTGSFPGTAGMVKHQSDGTVWAILLNTSCWNGPEISTEVNYFITSALSKIHKWPEHDLFAYYINSPLSDDIFMK